MASSLQEKINKDLVQALKNKEEIKVQTLRLLSSVIHNREIEKRAKGQAPELDDDEVLEVVSREVKKRKEAAALYLKGGRPELAEKENAEAQVLQTYLPPELSDEEIERVLEGVILKIKPAGEADFGRLMGEAMKELRGRAEASLVARKLHEKLGKSSGPR